MLKRLTVLVPAVLVSSPLLAHPGHGAATTSDAGSSISHWMFEPLHASMFLSIAVVIAVVGLCRRVQRPVQNAAQR